MKHKLFGNLKLVKLPLRIELALYLIKGELRLRKFCKAMEQAGLDGSENIFEFSPVILELVGFQHRNDDVYTWYNDLVQKHAEDLNLDDHERLHECAFNFYLDLEFERRSRNKTEQAGI